ncbi:MAG: 3-deoxy-manno-octulosonate cytidylyltransferase [uncultured bacterium]|nr:MAG: 3-deoxy-manno-octulosonate cytidylyltransferase [uncultured bacterium]
MKVGFLITVRLKSTRLPMKAILKLQEKEMVSWMIKRVKLSPVVDQVVIATSTNPQDDQLEIIAKRENAGCFRGSEDDVLGRLYGAAKKYQLDYILSATADCPLVAYDFFQKAVNTYRQTKADLLTCLKLPIGLFFYGIDVKALKKVVDRKRETNTEVWGGFFINDKQFKVVDMTIDEKYQRQLRLTIDYPEDFRFLESLFVGLGKNAYKKTGVEIIDYLASHPDLVDINWHCQDKYRQRIGQQIKKTRYK